MRVELAVGSGAGISFYDTMNMDDETVIAAIMVTNDFYERTRS